MAITSHHKTKSKVVARVLGTEFLSQFLCIDEIYFRLVLWKSESQLCFAYALMHLGHSFDCKSIDVLILDNSPRRPKCQLDGILLEIFSKMYLSW